MYIYTFVGSNELVPHILICQVDGPVTETDFKQYSTPPAPPPPRPCFQLPIAHHFHHDTTIHRIGLPSQFPARQAYTRFHRSDTQEAQRERIRHRPKPDQQKSWMNRCLLHSRHRSTRPTYAPSRGNSLWNDPETLCSSHGVAPHWPRGRRNSCRSTGCCRCRCCPETQSPEVGIRHCVALALAIDFARADANLIADYHAWGVVGVVGV